MITLDNLQKLCNKDNLSTKFSIRELGKYGNYLVTYIPTDKHYYLPIYTLNIETIFTIIPRRQ